MADKITGTRRFVVSSTTAFAVGDEIPNVLRHRAFPSSNRSNNPLFGLTTEILQTYVQCNPKFKVIDRLPQRILTNPSEGVHNNGADNEDRNLICRVHDKILCDNDVYTILDLLGTGTFGQVFKCQKDGTKQQVAIKIIKNQTAYYNQGLLEIKIARLLNNTFDPNDEHHLVRLIDYFEFKNHICVVFELLSMSLLDILTQNQFRGLPLSVVQRFTRQILSALVIMEEAKIIHCDLKPENILLAPPKAQQQKQPPPVPSQQSQQQVSSEQPTKKNKTENNAATTSDEVVQPSSQTSSQGTTAKATDTKGHPEPPSLLLVSGSDPSQPGDDSSVSSTTEPVVSAQSAQSSSTTKNTSGTTTATATATEAATAATSTTAPTTAATDAPKQSGGRLGVWSDVKVIDLGSACFEGKTMYSYIQSRFYRSPEVLLGIPYNGAIDMWSLACVCAEMYLGLPLFPGVSQHNQLTRIVEMMGNPPDALIEGKNGGKYFTKVSPSLSALLQNHNYHGQMYEANQNTRSTLLTPQDNLQTPKYRLKTAEEYASETNTEIPVLRKYLRYSKLEDVIMKCPLPNKSRLTSEQKKEEMLRRLSFLNFLQGLFRMNPFERWTAKQAAQHPFITNAVFTGEYIPPSDAMVNERKLAYLVLTQQKDRLLRMSMNNQSLNLHTTGPHSYNNRSSNLMYNNNDNGQHAFLPLHRRLSEPVHCQSSQSRHEDVPPFDSEDLRHRTMRRGSMVTETRDGIHYNNMETPQHQSLPLFDGNYLRQQDQQYMATYQDHVRQQQAEMMLSTSPAPQQYSAYSADIPKGEYLSNYYMSNAGGAESSEHNRQQGGGGANNTYKNYVDVNTSLASKQFASADDLQDVKQYLTKGGSGFPTAMTAGIKIPGGGQGGIGQGLESPESIFNNARNAQLMGSMMGHPGIGQSQHHHHQQYHHQQQQQQQQQHHHQQQPLMSRLGMQASPSTSSTSSSLAAQLRESGGGSATSGHHRSGESSQQMFQFSPASSGDAESSHSHGRNVRSGSGSVSGGVWTDGRVHSKGMEAMTRDSLLVGTSGLSNHAMASARSSGASIGINNSNSTEQFRSSSLGDSSSMEMYYGRSMPGGSTVTDPAGGTLGISDFANALMRPEMDERRRLQSMQPMGALGGGLSVRGGFGQGRDVLARQQPYQHHQQQQQQQQQQQHLPHSKGFGQGQGFGHGQGFGQGTMPYTNNPKPDTNNSIQEHYQQYYQQQQHQQQQLLLHLHQQQQLQAVSSDRQQHPSDSNKLAGNMMFPVIPSSLSVASFPPNLSGVSISTTSSGGPGPVSGTQQLQQTPPKHSNPHSYPYNSPRHHSHISHANMGVMNMGQRQPSELRIGSNDDDDDDRGDDSSPPTKAQNFSVNLLIRSSGSSTNLKLSEKTNSVNNSFSNNTPIMTPQDSYKGKSDHLGQGQGMGAQVSLRSPLITPAVTPTRTTPTQSMMNSGSSIAAPQQHPITSHPPGHPQNAQSSGSRSLHGQNSRVSGHGQQIVDVADALADWDPFFGAGDIEESGGGAGGSSNNNTAGNRNLGNSSSRPVMMGMRRVDIHDSVDDVDADDDDGDWRSIGGSTEDASSPRKLATNTTRT